MNNDLSSNPGLCISLARQGYVAFSYDMVGYNDSGLQVEHASEDLRTRLFRQRQGASLGREPVGAATLELDART